MSRAYSMHEGDKNAHKMLVTYSDEKHLAWMRL